MAWVLGETVSESFYTGNTGETFTRVSSYISGSVSVWNPTITELGSGYYRWSYTPAVAGSFEWVGAGSGGSPVAINFDLEATGVTVTISAATTGALTQTLAQLRKRVAERLGDYDELTATSNGTTTTFIDVLYVSAAAEQMKGRFLVLSDGTVHRVTGFTEGTNTLTFLPAAGSTSYTATNSVAALYNKRGAGFAPALYKNAINNAINDAFPLGLIRVQASVAAVFDADTELITIPASMTHVQTVEFTDSDGLLHELPRSIRSGEYGWTAIPATGQLRLMGYPGGIADGLALMLTGYGRQAELSADSDTCALSAEFIVARACYHLCYSALDKDQKFRDAATTYEREANRLRNRLRTYKDPGTLAVRAA